MHEVQCILKIGVKFQGWHSVNQFPRIDRSAHRESRVPFNSVMESSRSDLVSVNSRVMGPFDRSVSVKGKNAVVPARLRNQIGPIYLVHIGPGQQIDRFTRFLLCNRRIIYVDTGG
jgi:hypothetical protein